MSVLKKKAEIIMLPVNKASKLHLGKTLENTHEYSDSRPYWQPQELYFVDDSPIKEGDWKYNPKIGIWQHKREGKNLDEKIKNTHHPDTKKIIATTDKSLIIPVTEEVLHTPSGKYSDEEPYYMISTHMKSLPQPDDSFIISYIKAFNKGNPIKFVMVDYGIKWTNFQDDESESYLKVDKNNIITITNFKNSWSREELQKLFDSYGDNFAAKIIWEDILNL